MTVLHCCCHRRRRRCRLLNHRQRNSLHKTFMRVYLTAVVVNRDQKVH